MNADDTVTALQMTVIDRGRAPEFIRCDNGPELTAHALHRLVHHVRRTHALHRPGITLAERVD